MSRPLTPLLDRFLTKFVVDEASGCWLWTASLDGDDRYGQMGVPYRRAPEKAHRVAYQLFVGPIPNGMVIDHVAERGCTSKRCVNPAHLEAVTQLENVRRYHGNGAKTHCPQGHPYSGDNLYVWRGGRMCRTCRNERLRRRREARR